MKTFAKLISILCSTVLIGVRGAELPSFITPCSISLPTDQLSNCITTQARIAQPIFANGLPEYGLEPLDPLKLTNVEANTGTFVIKSSNVVLTGLGKMDIKELKMDVSKMAGSTKIIGNLSFTSDYETAGRIFFIPVNGKGKLTVKMYDTEIAIKYKIRLVKDNDGVDHVEAYDSRPSQKYGNVKIHMSDILGDATISQTINQVLNENWRDLMKEVGPPYIKAVSYKVQEHFNKLYSMVPYEKMVLP